MHLAVLTNQAPLVRRLVVAGASVLHRDRFGNTPLHLACRDGAFECAKALLFPVSQEERKAALLTINGIPQPLPQDLEQRNYDGMWIIFLFSTPVTRTLKEKGKHFLFWSEECNAIRASNSLLAGWRTNKHRVAQDFWDFPGFYFIFHDGKMWKEEGGWDGQF